MSETSKTAKWRVGDRRWEVEWCSELPMTEYGDADVDRATYQTALVTTREAAYALAKKVYPQSVIGSVSIMPVEYVPYDDDDALRYPHVGFWESRGEVEYYEGEDKATAPTPARTP